MRVEDREKAGISSTNPKPRPPPNPSATIFVANVSYLYTWHVYIIHENIISLPLSPLRPPLSLSL